MADGRVVIAVGNNGQFGALANWLEMPELVLDARFAENPDRNTHRVELAGIIQGALRSKTRVETVEGLSVAGVPAAVINDVGQAFAESQVRHRGGRIELPHATAGVVPAIANPLHLSASPITYRNGPPVLGEHTDEVLSEVLGLDADRLADLRMRGVL